MRLYIVGPSGVGKTTTARAVAREGFADALDLDHECDPVGSWPEIETLLVGEQAATMELLVIGAGTQAAFTSELLKFFARRRNSLVALLAEPAEVYEREPLRNSRSLPRYVATEFSPHRLALYTAATHRVNVQAGGFERARNELRAVIDVRRSAGPRFQSAEARAAGIYG